ncbi:MAG: dienelactone hydrolase family protein [Planctomycetota bacterium]
MKKDPPLDRITIETGDHPTAAVIWLHGLGADGHDFEPIIPELDLAGIGPVRFIFPHAPVRPVTINGGMTMRAWYDILEISIDRKVDEAGIEESSKLVEALLAEQIESGIAPQRLILAGFSQGGAMAYHVGLKQPELAGILVLSAYLPIPTSLQPPLAQSTTVTPLLCCHGLWDPVVPVSLGESSATQVKEAGWPLEWKTFPAPHSLHPDEVTEISRWIKKLLSEASA